MLKQKLQVQSQFRALCHSEMWLCVLPKRSGVFWSLTKKLCIKKSCWRTLSMWLFWDPHWGETVQLHEELQVAQCPSCSYKDPQRGEAKRFSRCRELASHKRIHMGEKPYQCTVCGKSFSGSCLFARHKRTHTGEKPYKCLECSNRFSSWSSLSTHKKRHMGEKATRMHKVWQMFEQLQLPYVPSKDPHRGEAL